MDDRRQGLKAAAWIIVAVATTILVLCVTLVVRAVADEPKCSVVEMIQYSHRGYHVSTMHGTALVSFVLGNAVRESTDGKFHACLDTTVPADPGGFRRLVSIAIPRSWIERDWSEAFAPYASTKPRP